MVKKLRTEPNLKNLKINIGMILVVKLVIAIAFLFWLLVIREQPMLNLMVDQYLYLGDIDNVLYDLSFLLAPDEQYYANHTLYSRFTGVVAWIVRPITEEPIASAVLVNAFSHCLIAYYSTKLYLFYNGRNPLLFLYIVSFSPTLMAYNFFALRDLVIVFMTVLFVYLLARRRLIRASLVVVPVIYLRPLLVLFLFVAVVASFSLRRLLRSKHKLFYSFLSLIGLFVAGYGVVLITGFGSGVANVSAILSFEYFVQAFGFGTFIAENDSVVAGRGVVNATRIFMVDSILAPPLSLVGLLVFAKWGDAKRKEISMFAVFLLLLMAYSYVSITGRYAFRKILPVFPFLLITAMLMLEYGKEWKFLRKQKRRVRGMVPSAI